MSVGTGTWWRLNWRERGHDVVAPDLPCDDDSAGLSEYADTVIEAIGERTDLVVVAQSLGGFTAPLVCERVPVKLLVLVAPMIPVPGEAPADYWTNTRYAEEVREHYDDEVALFYQDVPPELVSEALKRGRRQSETRMGEPSPLKAWPDVPTRVLLCRRRPLVPRRTSFAASPGSAWASRPTSSTVVIPLRSAARRSWPTTWRRARPRWA